MPCQPNLCPPILGFRDAAKSLPAWLERKAEYIPVSHGKVA
jgi:hypothetical protein